MLGRTTSQQHSSTDSGQPSSSGAQLSSAGSSAAHSARQSYSTLQTRLPPNPTSVPNSRPDLDEIDQWLEQAAKRWAHMAYGANEHIRPPSPTTFRGVIAYIDSQATNFVVPTIDYLDSITDHHPSIGVDTANGQVQPEAIGDMSFNISDDKGNWHCFTVRDVWVLPTCDRVLYSQRRMHEMGVQHHLDNGYIVLPNGARRSVSSRSYTIEITFGQITQSAAYSSSSLPLLRSATKQPNHSQRGRGADSRAQVPQALVWQRLGFPSKQTWLHTMEAVVDHGLPDHTHLKHGLSCT